MEEFIKYLGILDEDEELDLLSKANLEERYQCLKTKEKQIFNKIIEDDSYLLLKKYISEENYKDLENNFGNKSVRDDFCLLSMILSKLIMLTLQD